MSQPETYIPLHPACEMFPPMSESEYEALCDSIAFDGLLDPITTITDNKIQMILDGRSRYLACLKTKVEPRFVEYTGADPFVFVCQKNLHRRHLTSGQRAIIADRMREHLRGSRMAEGQRRGGLASIEKAATDGRVRSAHIGGTGGGKWVQQHPQLGMVPRSARHRRSITTDTVAAAMKVSAGDVSEAATLKSRHPDLYAQVEAGTMALNRAEIIRKQRESPEGQVKEVIAKNHISAARNYARATTDVEINEINAHLHEIKRRITLLAKRDRTIVNAQAFAIIGEEELRQVIDLCGDIIRSQTITIVTVGS